MATNPFRADAGVQTAQTASWQGATGVPGLYYNSTTGWMARKPDNTEVALGGGAAALGNWTFSGNDATLTGAGTMTVGATVQTALTLGRTSSPTTLNSTLVSLRSGTSDGASAVCIAGDTTTAWSNATAKLLSLRTNGVEKWFWTPGGNMGMPANASFTGASSATNTTGLSSVTTVADGASSIAFDYNNAATLSTAGWKMSRWRNNGTEFASLTGSIFAAGGLRLAADGSAFIDMSLNGATNIGYGSNYLSIGTASCTFNGQGPRSDGTTTLGVSGTPWPALFTSRPTITNQIISAAASITVNPASGSYVRINLSATAITSMTISAGQNGEMMIVEVVEDATGTRAIPTTWTNVSFNAGSYTASAGANKHDMLLFVYNSTFAKWVEVCRSVGDT